MFDFMKILLTSEATGDNANSGGMGNIVIYIVIGLVVVAAVVMLIMSNVSRRKQQKESEKQKNSLRPGDTVETVGGIIGKIVVVRPSATGGTEFVIETGEPERATTLTVDMQALYRILTQVNAPAAPAAEDKKSATISKPDVDGIHSASDTADLYTTQKNTQKKNKK